MMYGPIEVPTCPEDYITRLDKLLEVAGLVADSEIGFARQRFPVLSVLAEENACRLEVFVMGVMNALADRLGGDPPSLELLAYLQGLVEHGPGVKARHACVRKLSLINRHEMAGYLQGGQSLMRALLAGGPRQPGTYAALLADEARYR